MNKSSLIAISPIDGRYRNKVKILRKIFSEYAFFKTRLKIEIRWLQKLSSIKKISELPKFSKKVNFFLDSLIKNFSLEDAKRIKEIEKHTKHDIKSVEIFLKEKIKFIPELKIYQEFIHFCCTSDDINNIAYAVSLKKCKKEVILPFWNKILKELKKKAIKYRDVTMISRTHGKPAIPTTFGKEIFNFFYRLKKQVKKIKKIDILGKFNGAIGNFNAHYFSYPNINWKKVSKEFVESFKICWNPYTTQIEPHDYISEFFQCILRFNTILINCNQDIWNYILIGYVDQNFAEKEIGSSTMPHKVNPVNFENSEGNLGLANALISFVCIKLPISRLQRDLTDSTVLRNLGVIISHSLIAYKSFLYGIKKIVLNKKKIISTLDNHWELLSEPVQTIMRKYGIKNAYEKIRKFSQGKKVSFLNFVNLINSLQLPEKEKNKLILLKLEKYIGLSNKFLE